MNLVRPVSVENHHCIKSPIEVLVVDQAEKVPVSN